MKYCILLLITFFSFAASAQTDSSIKKLPNGTVPVAFIKGHRYEQKISAELFKKDFELALSDSSYEIVSFVVNWDDSVTNIISEKLNYGSVVKMPEFDPTLATISVNSVGFFEKIVIKKNGQLYYACSFVYKVAGKQELEKYLKTLARCEVASLGTYQNSSTIVSPVYFNNSLELILTDPSYSIVSFELEVADRSGDYATTTINSKTIELDKDGVTRKLRSLTAGCFVGLSKIKLSKNGKIYEAAPFALYVK
jgi:hypothetical protein